MEAAKEADKKQLYFLFDDKFLEVAAVINTVIKVVLFFVLFLFPSPNVTVNICKTIYNLYNMT